MQWPVEWAGTRAGMGAMEKRKFSSPAWKQIPVPVKQPVA
jgi:hypothetical protein